MADTPLPQHKKRQIAQKWGFGMAPISPGMRQRYNDAVQAIGDFIAGKLSPEEVSQRALVN